MLRLKSGLTFILLGVIVVQAFLFLYLLAFYQNIENRSRNHDNTNPLSKYFDWKYKEGPNSLGNGNSNLQHPQNIIADNSVPKSPGPIVYVVTPTFRRVTQRADITRLSQTLRHLDFVFWLIVEDGEKTYHDIEKILAGSGVPFKYIAAPVPEEHENTKHLGRGVFNRRAALDWLRKEQKIGVLYFADDDNTYDIKIFHQIQSTHVVSVFPVGMVQQFGISSPIVRKKKVVGFHDAFQGGRTFAMDMAGFAVNLYLLYDNPTATIPLYVSTLEDGFLKELGVKLQQLEPKANYCTEVLVWHTRTQRAMTPDKKNIPAGSEGTNLQALYDNII